MPITQLYTKICVYYYSSDLLLMSNFELWMLNIKITLQKKWSIFTFRSLKSLKWLRWITHEKKIWSNMTYICMSVCHQTTIQIILLQIIHYCWMKNIYEIIIKKNVYHYTALFIFSNFSKLHLYKMMLIHGRRKVHECMYSRYRGSSARDEWQTFLPS